jgi:hypothetical protein
MLIENHTGVFVIDKRLRGFGDVRLPGDGISYTTLGWAIAGGLVGLIVSIPVALFVGFLGHPAWPVPLFVAVGAVVAARVGGRRGSDGRSSWRRLQSWVVFRFTSRLILDGRPFRGARYRSVIDACVAVN